MRAVARYPLPPPVQLMDCAGSTVVWGELSGNREIAAGPVALLHPCSGGRLGFYIKTIQPYTRTEECNTYTFRSVELAHSVC